ncbi:MAG: HEPN domain-containing protein [Chloroflexi bacterium]|nr:HEPN domain-containing protein [Chloroflexota bacterium]
MSDPSNPLDWAAKADDDLTLAQSALRRKRPIAHLACFHAQQCAEKYMKALLVMREHPFSKVHDLIEINNELTAAGILMPIPEDDLSTLSSYAVPARYPGNDPTLEDAREAMISAKAVRKFARKFLNV